MDDERFWALVEQATPHAATDPIAFDEALTEILKPLGPDAVVAFNATWVVVARRALHWDVWAAAWVILWQCHDAEFAGFRDRLVALGRSVFERALRDADSLAEPDVDWRAGGDDEDAWMSLAAYEAFEALTGEELGDTVGVVPPEPPEPPGLPWDLVTVADRVPRLAEKYEYTHHKVRLRGPCPCCGSLTVAEPAVWDSCEVCLWIDEPLSREQPGAPTEYNVISLEEGQENFRRYGVCDPQHREAARPPRLWERPG